MKERLRRKGKTTMHELGPREIEERSMAIIEEQVPDLALLPLAEREVVKRAIHTTGDLAFGQLIRFHPAAVAAACAAIRAGKPVVCDVNMVRTGINNTRLAHFGMEAVCLVGDPEVARDAVIFRTTRAALGLRRACAASPAGLVAVGNAPTALFALCELIDQGRFQPDVVVATAVGFVGAAESKELLMAKGVPYIAVTGTRGGSAVAAAMVNALLNLAARED